MLKPLISYLVIALICFQYKAQDVSKNVAFLHKTPIIDGQLDEELESLDKKTFNYIWQFDNPVTDTVAIHYRMAYTPTHLYLYIETAADEINYRNRGESNGDGFQLLLAKPQLDTATNEFYNLCFSPSRDNNYWARFRIAEYNKKQSSRSFSPASFFKEKVSNGKCGFEALISWQDIPPYHPWFLDKIGYNLYFAKAIGDTITNGYAVVEDEGIWDEEIPKRHFELLEFEPPISIKKEFILLTPQRKNLKIEEPLILEIVSISPQDYSKKLNITLVNEEDKILFSQDITISSRNTLKKEDFTLEIGALPPAKYTLIASSSKDTITKTEIVIFPEVKFKIIQIRLQMNPDHLAIGVVNTLHFKLAQLRQKLTELKIYESGEDILDYLNNFQKEYNLYLEGIDPYQKLKGPYRRAFQSKYDHTFQPYSIKLPEHYDPNKVYPLLVFLHGSGQDEQRILNSPRSNGAFIELAPLARDIYRAYASDESQKDIIEAIDDVSKHFSVDHNKIIIGGFSMGGYGALRTFYEHPELYKGVAVFAGHPYLASYWLDEEHPHFLQDKFLAPFSGVPVFIYHGEKDGALPVQLIKKMDTTLRNNGANVTISIVKNRGHQYPDQATNDRYFDWLNKIINE